MSDTPDSVTPDLGIDYPRLIEDALRGVVRRALAQVAEEGLPDDHHFYVELATRAPGVSLPPWLADSHPETIQLVLQHQFWNLEVDEESFAVDLRFGGQRVRVVVPFAAVTTFADPSVPIVLQFSAIAGEEPAAATVPRSLTPVEQSGLVPVEREEEGSTTNVVSIDRFRKR